MSTSKQFIEYFIDRTTGIGDITLKSMMGEYLIYYRGKRSVKVIIRLH